MSDERATLACDVCAIARRASQAILQVYESEFAVTRKSDNSPLTEADLAAHRVIKQGLASLKPDWPILSEESAAVPWPERSQWQRYWLVDPLDGTREFVKRNGEFTVNIALIENHRPVLGVVLAPVTNELYCAWMGGGAFAACATDNFLLKPLRTRARAQPLIVTGSRSHNPPKTLQVLTRVGPYELQPLGSSLKFCRIASGDADLYLRHGPTSEWDTAAGQCVLEEAGGAVTDFTGVSLGYNNQESLLNPDFLAFGDSAVNWAKLCATTL